MKDCTIEVICLAHTCQHYPLLQDINECESLLKIMATHFPGETASLSTRFCESGVHQKFSNYFYLTKIENFVFLMHNNCIIFAFGGEKCTEISPRCLCFSTDNT